jgi:small subunit ribosomal protein S16
MRHQPSYRIVVADKESPRDGRFLEIVGTYNPTTDPFTIEVKEEKVFGWLKNGAVPSESVTRLFQKVGLMDRFDRFKKGEALEGLMAEAKIAYEKHAANA